MNKNETLTIEEIVKEQNNINQKEDLPELINSSLYLPYKQNPLSDNLMLGLLDEKDIDPLGNAIIIRQDQNSKYEIQLKNYSELENCVAETLYSSGKVSQSACKLLDCLIIQLQQSNYQSSTVEMPLSTYAKYLNRSDKKTLREKVKKDLEVLDRVKIQRTPLTKNNKNQNDFFDANLCASKGYINGKIQFEFTPKFYELFKSQRYYMWLPICILQTNEKDNPHAYSLGKTIERNFRMNQNKPRQNIIKVRTLYKYCNTLPKYENVMATDGAVERRIIKPFERDLDSLSSSMDMKWEYKNSDGVFKTFEEWLNTDITFKFGKNHPTYDTIKDGRDREKKRIEKAKQNAKNKQELYKLKKKAKD